MWGSDGLWEMRSRHLDDSLDQLELSKDSRAVKLPLHVSSKTQKQQGEHHKTSSSSRAIAAYEAIIARIIAAST